MRTFVGLGLSAVVCSILIAGCSVAPEERGEGAPPRAQQEASDAEEAAVTSAAESVRRGEEALAALADDPVVQPAVEALRARRDEHGLGGAHDLRVRRVTRGVDGRHHARLEHRYQGVRVLSSTAVLHVGADGVATELETRGVKRGVEIDTAPRLTEAEARAVVDARPERTGHPVITPRAELVIVPEMRRVVRSTGAPVRGDEEGLDAMDVERRVVGARLAYQIDTLDRGKGEPFASHRFLVDARTGEVIRARSLAHGATGTGISFQNDGPSGDFRVPIDTRPFVDSGRVFFEPFDSLRNFGVWDEDFSHTDGSNRTSNNIWGDGKAFAGEAIASLANRRTAIADGLYAMQVTWDMLHNVFHRDGYDDAFYSGSAYVHSGDNWANAKYYSLSHNIAVGDGAGSSFTSLDTFGHEFGHGLNDFTAGLGDNAEAEGLNEATGDILGEVAEAYELGNGQVGPLDFIPASPGPNFRNDASGRDFANPNGPRAWSAGLAGEPDEHTRALPMDHAFFFLSQGSSSNPASSQFAGTVPWGMRGIGIDHAAQIWIHALISRMTSDEDYADARVHCRAAALDLFGAGSPEVAAVENAFAAISVGATNSSYPLAPSAMAEAEPNNQALFPNMVIPVSPPAGAPLTGSLFKRKLVFGVTSQLDVDDHFAVSVPPGRTLRVTLLPRNDSALAVLTPNGSVLASSNHSGTAAEQINIAAPNDGVNHAFTLRVRWMADVGSISTGMYNLYVDIL